MNSVLISVSQEFYRLHLVWPATTVPLSVQGDKEEGAGGAWKRFVADQTS